MAQEAQYKILDSGEARLVALGYKQELKRDFNLFTSTAISFSIISCISGVSASYGIAWNNGGPATVVWGWITVFTITMAVAVAMGEIVSSLPSSGGPYFWAAHLSTKKYSPFAAWMTGWFNILGQITITAGIDFAFTNQLAGMWVLSNGHILTQGQLLAVYTVTLVCHGLINTMPTKYMSWLCAVSVVWHILGAAALTIVIPIVAPTHQSNKFVWGTFYSVDSGPPATANPEGLPNNEYMFFLGLLMAQFTITGYDASGHMSEETTSADFSAAVGVVLSCGLSAIVGFSYLLALTYSIQDPTTLTTGSANGYVSGQIISDIFTARYGNNTGGIVMMGIPLIALFFCGATSVASNARMCWSFARDGALPFSKTLSRVNRFSGTPINAMIFMVVWAFLLATPMLKSTVAFSAVISISTIGLYISYGIPILVRLFNHKNFEPGPFYCGATASIIIGIIGVSWIVCITVFFVLPTAYPVTTLTLNYAPVAVGIVLGGALLSFFCPFVGARLWYRGEKHTVEDFTVHKKAAELAAGMEKGRKDGYEDSAHGANHAAKKLVE